MSFDVTDRRLERPAGRGIQRPGRPEDSMAIPGNAPRSTTTTRRGGSRRLAAAVGVVALASVTMMGSTADVARAAVVTPIVQDPGFEARSWLGTQHNHAEFVSPGRSGSGSAVQVGLRYANSSDTVPVGGNLPVKGTGVQRGMVNKTV